MSNSLFEIVEIDGKGKAMRAKQEVPPGTELFREYPLLLVPQELLSTFQNDSGELGQFVAAYSVFQTLTEDQKCRYLCLFGPTTGESGVALRRLATEKIRERKPSGEVVRLTDSEADLALRVMSIYKYNAVGDKECGPLAVYELCSRMSHSCLPNCRMRQIDAVRACYTILPVPAGEELTICYNEELSSQPTHIRRQRYLNSKEFTCHCPRCDAPGDDTRQFNCFDKKCDGVHFVYQPINLKPLAYSDLTYTGVEYVEPHLLSCTVCHLSPPLAYQIEALKLEASQVIES